MKLKLGKEGFNQERKQEEKGREEKRREEKKREERRELWCLPRLLLQRLPLSRPLLLQKKMMMMMEKMTESGSSAQPPMACSKCPTVCEIQGCDGKVRCNETGMEEAIIDHLLISAEALMGAESYLSTHRATLTEAKKAKMKMNMKVMSRGPMVDSNPPSLTSISSMPTCLRPSGDT